MHDEKTPTLPDWYFAAAPDCTGQTTASRRRGAPAVRRALGALGEMLARELSASARTDSWLGRMEPRAKAVSIVGLIVVTTLIHGLPALAAVLLAAVVSAMSSGIGMRRVLRIWLGVPLFSLAIVLPAMLSLVTPGTAMFTLWHSAGAKIGPWTTPESITVTREGLAIAGRFVLRSLDAVTLAFLLIATTEQASLLNGLRRLGMPRIFGMVLGMAQRYLTVMLRTAEEIHLAKLSRTITADSIRREQRWVAAGMGILFRRTHRLAQEVHSAMVSRGYNGEIHIRHAQEPALRDAVLLLLAMVFAAGLVLVDRVWS